MILTNDTTKDQKLTKGQRTLAKEFFEDKDVLPRVRNRLMGATVLIKSGGNKASGVIIDVDQNNVYVLTAKHVLYSMEGKTSPPNKKNSSTQKIRSIPGC